MSESTSLFESTSPATVGEVLARIRLNAAMGDDVRAKVMRAYETAHQAKTLAELEQALRDYDGCDLKKGATNTVFCDGNPASGVMLVGEAPGQQEDVQGKPFVGASGQLMDKMMKEAGFDRTKVYISNVVFWRPPDNRLPTPLELELCRPFVERHIALVNPKFLVFVGGTSAKFMLRSADGITKIRGRWQGYNNPWLSKPIETLPTYHPSYLLRSPSRKGEAWQDFLSLRYRVDKAS